MAEGQLITVVGPSGAGKDSILASVKATMPNLEFVRRTITRPQDGGFEEHIPVDENAFDVLSKHGQFLFEWSAHGLRYGVPNSVQSSLDDGKCVIFNGSRGALPKIANRFPDILVISIEVSREVLRERLLARGRELEADIEARLDREVPFWPEGVCIEHVDNDGPLENAVAQFTKILRRKIHGGRAV
ncbi:MAG: phosphonate metabolism protein/1,5-bisphosphokinase (PRPP-forming) PhnN [Pseudomonadota bacterium]